MSTNPKSKIQNLKSKRIVILGGGPAGLYAGLLIKKADPSHDITVIERNPADVTYGWGVVFSDRTLSSFQRADYKTYQQIEDRFVIWDAIDVRYRGATTRCGGHVIAAISRKDLLNILQARCAELGVELHFNSDITGVSQLPQCDLLIAADGVNSIVRKTYEEHFKPSIELGKAKYIWLGANKVLDAFTFIFHENEHGLFTVHAYPFSGTTSTFVVECDEASWLRAGLDKADEAETLAYCQQLLAADLGGAGLLSNNSKWINFPTLTTQNWSYQNPKSKIQNPKSRSSQLNIVLLGDAVHTAHFSIGSGTKLAMEDAIALAGALEQHSDLQTALNEYEAERKPVVETFQRAARESQTYFETIKRYLGLEPMQFTFQLLTRSGRITYNDLKLRDARFGDAVDRWFSARTEQVESHSVLSPQPSVLVAPPPVFAPIAFRGVELANRLVVSPVVACPGREGAPTEEYAALLKRGAEGEAGLVMTDICAVSPGGRITPGDLGMYDEGHAAAWARVVEAAHGYAGARIGARLGHAGRRGSTRPRTEGLDRPLREGNWPLVSASAVPYTPLNQVPQELDREGMDRVRSDFVRAVRMAQEVGFDLLQLHFAQGYLLASFLSPLANLRTDEYGGDLANRVRFPLEVFEAVRAEWPAEKPIAVAVNVTDAARGGFDIPDAVAFTKMLKERGCDLVEALAGQTVPEGEIPYGRGFLTPLSDRVRNGAGIPTMVGGYLTTTNDVNTILAAGRADLCVWAG